MEVKLSTGKIYDLSNSDEVKNLRKNISTMRSRGQYDRLELIYKQVEHYKDYSGDEFAFVQARNIYKILYDKDSYAFLNSIQSEVVNLHEIAQLSVVKAENSLQNVLNMNEIIESGETSFQELYAHLMLDMSHYSGDINLFITYASLVVNLFMHAATFTPTTGHGKAQDREFKNKSQLQYIRSQGDHANAKFFRELIERLPHEFKSRLPLNKGFLKLIDSPDFDEEFCRIIKKFDPDTGYPKSGGKVRSHDILKIAHAGARRNNLSITELGMQWVVSGVGYEQAPNILQETLKQVLKPTSKINALDLKILLLRIQDLLNRFKNTKVQKLEDPVRLTNQLLEYRIRRVNMLRKQINSEKLRHIRIDDKHNNITCVLIRLYPHCENSNDTYREGVTNVLLSFFAALLNHNTKKQRLRVHVERRQSFGFLRPTITDAGNLTIRLSLGLEPEVFDNVVIKSLEELDFLLEKFNFENPTHEVVKEVFKIKPGYQRDSYIRNVVRKDNNMLNTFRQAGVYLNQANGAEDVNYLETAMSSFLMNYVINGITLQEASVIKSQPAIIQACSSCIVDLLKNSLNYVLYFVSKLEFLKENEPLEKFAHCFWHSLFKLYNNYNEAQVLLSDVEKIEATEFHRRASLYVENILEYLVSLDGLKQIRAKLMKSPLDSIAKFRKKELSYCSKTLNVALGSLDLFMTDSGQQAITTALLALSVIFHGRAVDGRYYDQDIHLFGKSYFEVAEFMKDVKNQGGICEMRDLVKAKIIFVDITQLEQLNITQCIAMMVLVIDMTHYPIFEQEYLKELVKTMQMRNCWVVFVKSSLKHEQLGLDKYQSGSIITLSPFDQSFTEDERELFESVSREAMNPCIASYLQMVNKICRKKLSPEKEKVSGSNAEVLQKVGVFKLEGKEPIIRQGRSGEDLYPMCSL